MKVVRLIAVITACFFCLPVMGMARELTRGDALNTAIHIMALQKIHQEGFVAGTPIKTATGHKPIELIKLHDLIIGSDLNGKNYERTVRAVEKRQVCEFVKISIGDQLICVAPDQKFYCPQEKAWIAAKDLTTSHVLLTGDPAHSRLTSIENVKESAEVYTLTVDGHNLYITPYNVLVHNACIALPAIAQITLARIILSHPVMATIGQRIPLDIFNGKVYKLLPDVTGADAFKPFASLTQQEIDNNLLQERTYYENRKFELNQLKDQFIRVKTDIERISQQFHPFGKALTGALFNQGFTQVPLLPQPTAQQELQLNDTQKSQLTQLRETDLEIREKQIEDLQIALGVHINELVEHYHETNKYLDEIIPQFNMVSRSWNYSRDFSLQTVINHYEIVLNAEQLCTTLREQISELKLIIHYYKNSPNAQVLKNTSTINELFSLEQTLTDQDNSYKYNKDVVIPETRCVLEQSLCNYGVDVVRVKENIITNLKNKKNNRQAQAVREAQNKKTQHQFPKQPKKDDKEDKKEDEKKKHPNGKYEGADYHHPNSRGKKSPGPKDGQKALDNSVEVQSSPKEGSGKVVEPSPKRRIGIEDGQFVVFQKTMEGIYHGHLREFSELEKPMRDALENAGLINKLGKIIK